MLWAEGRAGLGEIEINRIVYMHMCVCVCVYMCMCVCVCVYMCMCGVYMHVCVSVCGGRGG